MTRELAEQRVSERWEYLKLNKAACPIMFGMDVDNMVEHPEDYIEVANQGKALQQGIESLRVGDDSGGASSVCAPVESSQSECLHYQALNTGEGVSSGVDTLGRFHGSPDDDQDQESGNLSLPRSRCAKGQDLPADSQILPSDTAHGIAGVQSTATDCTPETPFIRAIDHFTFRYLRFVDERLSTHALAQIAAKLPDLPLAEQYRLEEIDAASESGVQ